MEMLLEPILKILFIGIGYIVGFVPVLVGTLGFVKPGPVDCVDDGGEYYRSRGMRFWHVTFFDKGARYLPAEAVALVGWLVLAGIGAVSWALALIIV